MDEVLSLKPSVAIRRLQTAVRESQGTSRASYAAKNRPEWWKENVSVTLPDGSHSKTGAFVSHSKCAWKLKQVQAALVLFYRHWEENGSSGSEECSEWDSPPPRKAKRAPVKAESRPCRTRKKTNPAPVENAQLPQKFTSEPLKGASKPCENKKSVTFKEKHELNVHHTPPRNLRRNRSIPESSKNSKQNARTTSHRNEKEELSEMQLAPEVESKQSNPSSSSEDQAKTKPSASQVRRVAPRRLVKKTNVRAAPGASPTGPNSARHTLPLPSRTDASAVPKENRRISKRRSKKQPRKAADVTTKHSPELIAIDSDAPPETSSAANLESTPPGRIRIISRRRSSRLSTTEDLTTEDLTPKRASGVKRRLDHTLSRIRTPLAPLQNNGNVNVVEDVKRRKTAGKKTVAVRTARKSCRKENTESKISFGETSSEKENYCPGHATGTNGEGSGEQLVFSARRSLRLRPSPRASHSGNASNRENIENVSTASARGNDDEDFDNDTGNEGDYNDSNNHDCEDVDENEETLTKEEKKEQYDLIMSAVATLEREHDNCIAKLEEHRQRLVEDLQKEHGHKRNKLDQQYQMRLMHMSERERSTLVGHMVFELEGDPNNLLVKDVENAADCILNDSTDGPGIGDGSNNTQMELQVPKTPKARSLRQAAVAAATERKRVNRERYEATRPSVRRSTRKAAQTATARTREILTSAARPKSVASITHEAGAVGNRIQRETELSTPVLEAVQSEISRLRGLPNGRERLRALKAQLDGALSEIV